jgi:mRNA interferase HigB
MHVIAYPKIREFAEKYPNTKNALDRWFKTLSKNNYENFHELRCTFSNSVDQVLNCVVFNIGGNKVRVITKFLYSIKTVYIKYVLTHAEYDLDKWKIECKK